MMRHVEGAFVLSVGECAFGCGRRFQPNSLARAYPKRFADRRLKLRIRNPPINPRLLDGSGTAAVMA
jgi:hypothetical protein